MGEILEEWTAWRCQCVKRRVYFQLGKKRDKLHLLKGLERILLDIDKAIAIIRETELEAEVVPNLMIGFGIDQVQAEFVAEIKLRNINKEYILKRTAETGDLEREIQELEETLNSDRRIRSIIIGELEQVSKKFDSPENGAGVSLGHGLCPGGGGGNAGLSCHGFRLPGGLSEKRLRLSRSGPRESRS